MNSAQKHQPTQLRLWRMEFRDRSLELAFRQSEWDERSKQNTIAAGIATLTTAAILVLLTLSGRDQVASLAMFAEVLAGVILFAASRQKEYSPLYEWICASSVVIAMGAGVALVHIAQGPDAAMAAFVVAPLILAAGFNVVSGVFWAGIVIAVMGFYSVVRWRFDFTDIADLLRLQMILNCGLGVVIHRLINSSRRADFQERLQREREAARLEAARREAEAANAAKSRFLAGISHEIRTPMNGVLAVSELLLERSPRETQRELEIIRDSSRGLLRLLNDLIDLSAAESGSLRLSPAPFRLKDLTAQSMEVVRVKAVAKGVKLVCETSPDCPDWVLGDGSRLRQVLINLLANGVNFTTHGSVTLRVTQTTEGIRFEVQDTGPGIPEAELQHIFERFFRGSGRESGAGLGLSISREILQKMGSDLHVKNQGGACFWFTVNLPKCQPEEEAPLPEFSADNDARLLIVEDSRMNRFVLLEMLKSLGFTHVETVEEGRSVPERFAEFDLILLDLSLPEEDGWSIAAKIVAKGEARPRLIAVSAFALAAEQARATMDDFVAKPVEKRELIRALNCCLPRRAVLNQEKALAQMGGDPAVLAEAKRIALEEFPNWLKELRQASGDPVGTRFREVLHRFIGSLSTLHAEQALWRAERLQILSRSGERFDAALEMFAEAIARILRNET